MIATDDFIVNEHVDVRSHSSLLGQYAVTQAGVFAPQPVERFTDGRSGAVELNLRAAAGELR